MKQWFLLLSLSELRCALTFFPQMYEKSKAKIAQNIINIHWNHFSARTQFYYPMIMLGFICFNKINKCLPQNLIPCVNLSLQWGEKSRLKGQITVLCKATTNCSNNNLNCMCVFHRMLRNGIVAIASTIKVCEDLKVIKCISTVTGDAAWML